eukprot:m.76831 g.76831  ORF g.76831 m.76831 type:complete len:225 (-) comp19060_c0_seq1:308-982(-)
MRRNLQPESVGDCVCEGQFRAMWRGGGGGGGAEGEGEDGGGGGGSREVVPNAVAAVATSVYTGGIAPTGALEADAASFGTEEAGYEYLDHTADIQLHSWGRSIEESIEQVVVAMFGYMTELDKVDEDETQMQEFEIEGHDLISLLYNLMDEFLFRFVTEPFVVCRRVKILELDREAFKIRVQGFGEVFDLAKHPQGTEVKAITYSNMQIHHDKPRKDVYVIVDI